MFGVKLINKCFGKKSAELVYHVIHRVSAGIMGHIHKCYVISTVTYLTTELWLPPETLHYW